jgi:hypothetical protein
VQALWRSPTGVGRLALILGAAGPRAALERDGHVDEIVVVAKQRDRRVPLALVGYAAEDHRAEAAAAEWEGFGPFAGGFAIPGDFFAGRWFGSAGDVGAVFPDVFFFAFIEGLALCGGEGLGVE